MASGLDDDIFEKLKQKADPEVQRQKDDAFNARLHAQYEKHQKRVEDLNSSLPVSISQVRVLNAPHTRRSFLNRIVKPLLIDSPDAPQTLLEARQTIDKVAHQFNKLGIYHYPISVFVDKAPQVDPSTTPTDLAVYYSAQERSRYTLKTGTEAGNAEGSVFANGTFRNLFGGAESLAVNYSKGTRTRSAFSAVFDTPILSNPDFRWELGGVASSTLKPWASHEELLNGVTTKIKWITEQEHKHEFGYSGMWRQITALASNASPTVRADAGDSFKSSLTYSWLNDRRDYPLLASRGYMLKSLAEVAGTGPLGGDVGFGKVEVESQAAIPLPVPGLLSAEKSGITLNTGLRGGLLYPLPLATSDRPLPSRLNDRFQLGGPSDVRGFKISGLGPHDGADAVGGDIYAAGSLSLLFPFPRVSKDVPMRFQMFLNTGRLLALRGRPKDGADLDSQAVAESVRKTIQDLRTGLPSAAAGFGIVYAHPGARIELNFSLPLVMRRGEEGRKGLSFGVGLDFM